LRRAPASKGSAFLSGLLSPMSSSVHEVEELKAEVGELRRLVANQSNQLAAQSKLLERMASALNVSA